MISSDYIIYIVALVLISVVNYWIGKRDIIYPGFVFSFVWTLVFSTYVFSPININPIGTKTCMILLLGTVYFAFGCYFGLRFSFRNTTCVQRMRSKTNDVSDSRITHYQAYSKYLMFIYCIAVFPAYFNDISSFAGGNLSSISDIRAAMVKSVLDTGKAFSSIITGSAVNVAISSTFIAYIDHKKGSRFFNLSLILTLVYCILNTGRISLMTLLSGLVAINLIRNETRFSRAIIKIGVPLVIVVVLLMAYMFTSHQLDSTEGTMLEQAFNYFFVYIIGGIPALDTVVMSDYSGKPHHTFQFLTQLSNSILGTNYELPPPLDIYVNVPFPTNVYTCYKYFIQDFGIAGTFIVFLAIGFIYGFVYKKAKKGSKYAIYYYAILIFPPLMVFFDDLFSNFRGHIRDTIFIVVSYSIVPRLLNYLLIITSKRKIKQVVEANV